MVVNSMGYNFKEHKNWVLTRPHGLNEYTLLLIKSKAIIWFGDEKINVLPNSMIIFNKGTPQRYAANNEVFVNDWIHFSLTPEEEALLFKNTNILDKLVELENAATLSKIIKMMQEEYVSANAYKNKTLELFLEIICTKYRESFHQLATNKMYYNEMVKIRTKIYNTPSVKHTVENLAGELNLSKSYFQHLYKKYFDVSPITDVINSRIEYSKRLLSSTNYSVGTISELLGYSSDTQFMKQFKLITNMTPREYRKLLV
ncbi:MAG: helix-turn-helix transcriptional regulator [Clostridia bacterium]|nr:helix-turn-helix transcriptional regulator [Clostridia bacterium]